VHGHVVRLRVVVDNDLLRDCAEQTFEFGEAIVLRTEFLLYLFGDQQGQLGQSDAPAAVLAEDGQDSVLNLFDCLVRLRALLPLDFLVFDNPGFIMDDYFILQSLADQSVDLSEGKGLELGTARLLDQLGEAVLPTQYRLHQLPLVALQDELDGSDL